MRFRKEFKDDGTPVVRGDVTISKKCWLHLSPINEARDHVYKLSEHRDDGYKIHCGTTQGERLSEKPVQVTVIAQPKGLWEMPEYWDLDICHVTLSQDGNTYYDGPILRGCSGEVYSKSNCLFTNMKFFYDFFKKDLKEILDEEIDAWIMEEG